MTRLQLQQITSVVLGQHGTSYGIYNIHRTLTILLFFWLKILYFIQIIFKDPTSMGFISYLISDTVFQVKRFI